MAWIATAVAIAGAATTVIQGEQAESQQKRSFKAQQAAQKQTLLSAVNDERQAAMAERKANRRKPDVAALLFQERGQANTGVGSTILAGGGSKLGSKSLLMG